MASASAGPPNVLIIVVDCLRADRCPIEGNPLDLQCWPKLRAEGAAFSQMISSASLTSVCFAGLLTGEYSFVHGVRSLQPSVSLNASLPTLPGMLKQAGYTTHARVTGPLIRVFGLDRDFDDYQHRRATDDYARGPGTDTLYTDWGRSLMAELGGEALGAPWLVLLHLFEMHTPRQFNGARPPRSARGQYDLAFRQLDAKLAELVAGVPENTLIVLTADHGECYTRRADRTWGGRLWRKVRQNLRRPARPDDLRSHGFHVFDELVRIPCCIVGSGVPRGGVVDEQVRQIDLMPTVLEAVGIAPPTLRHGRSLLPRMRGEALADVAAYVESGDRKPARAWHGLRSGGWKYAEHPRSSEQVALQAMLFNLADDPGERRNVAAEHPDVVARMRQEIDRLLYDRPADQGPGGEAISEQEQAELDEHLRALGYI